MADNKTVQPKSDYNELELMHELVSPSANDRRGQRIRSFRTTDPSKKTSTGVQFLNHPAGVEVRGSAWSGVIPWSSIKVAKF